MLEKIAESDMASSSDLLSCMLIQKRDVRERVLQLIRQKEITEAELQSFVNQRLSEAYRNVFTLDRFEQLKADPVRDVIAKEIRGRYHRDSKLCSAHTGTAI